MRRHQILSHTADVRVKAEGSSREELFRAALEGMAQIQKAKLSESAVESKKLQVQVVVAAPDISALLIDFLSEALAQSQIEKAIFNAVTFTKLTSGELEAEISGARADGFEEDIKAVTYHGADIVKNEEGNYEATILFDI